MSRSMDGSVDAVELSCIRQKAPINSALEPIPCNFSSPRSRFTGRMVSHKELFWVSVKRRIQLGALELGLVLWHVVEESSYLFMVDIVPVFV